MIRRNENVVLRCIHGTFFLIDIADNYLTDKCALYEINEMGSVIWNILEIHTGTEEIVALLKELVEEDVEDGDLEADVNEYIRTLLQLGFLIEDNA